ncbi:hypothetical protein E2C01_010792 [Portunus trituberculatus]|uniref:Uncharacterized protein n=1 Tax=Portunus trituberculatus TaxID=210409 RepID=A0A5B7D9K0_PORTR|nr:hypothetical protein [Portunus trituberculatus]
MKLGVLRRLCQFFSPTPTANSVQGPYPPMHIRTLLMYGGVPLTQFY